jgi:hypothetical protein
MHDLMRVDGLAHVEVDAESVRSRGELGRRGGGKGGTYEMGMIEEKRMRKRKT